MKDGWGEAVSTLSYIIASSYLLKWFIECWCVICVINTERFDHLFALPRDNNPKIAAGKQDSLHAHRARCVVDQDLVPG